MENNIKSSQWIRQRLHKAGILSPSKKSWREKIIFYLSYLLRVVLQQRDEIIFADRQYTISTLQEIKDIIAKCGIDRKSWVEQVRDCDNFAFWVSAHAGVKYKNNSIGTCFGWVTDRAGKRMKHAWNCVVVDTGDVYFLEPQSDKIEKVKNGKAEIGVWIYSGISRCWFF